VVFLEGAQTANLRRVKRLCWILVWLLGSLAAFSQDRPLSLEEAADSIDQWAQANLDEDVLALLQESDQEKVKQLFANLEKRLRGRYVIDLAALKEVAKTVLPILESYEETYPYAVWLKTRLDYLEVAEQLREVAPPPEIKPGKPAKPIPNPAARKEREIWISRLAQRPWPPAAQGYVKRLKPIFAAQNAPEQLVWIAEVESSFDPRARSPAGAAGLFQLMPATAKRYGLRTWPWDQRLRPEPSAEAAAKYLEYLHDRFKDWRLALAAYNAGEGTVQNLLTKHKARTFDAIATYLPAETQMYVPKVEATLLRREGLKLASLR
jgi:membrane-bound lytic murein transglycosylase D